MVTTNALSEVAALAGDPARAGMLLALMDGRARGATDLASIAGVSGPTASGHLAKMIDAGLLVAERQGRRRLFSLAGPEVSRMIEAIMAVAAPLADTREGAKPASARAAWRRDARLRLCRTCYDHLAGQVGSAVADALRRDGHLEPGEGKDWTLTGKGDLFCRRIGVDLDAARALADTGRRKFARQCLDWSERRPHVAGALGAAFCDLLLARDWVARARGGRALELKPAGRLALRRVFDVEVPALPA